jgi:hypothetical protein
MSALLMMLAAHAADPGCKGRVSDRDREITFEIVLDALDDGPQRAIELRPGTGPDESRGSVQARLRTRMDALITCYEPRVTREGGPDLTVRVALDVANGRPVNVAVDTPPEEWALTPCLERVINETPMPCKLDAVGFVFPMRLYTLPMP